MQRVVRKGYNQLHCNSIVDSPRLDELIQHGFRVHAGPEREARFYCESGSLHRILHAAFRFSNFGYVAAMSFVLLVLTNLISVAYIRMLRAQDA